MRTDYRSIDLGGFGGWGGGRHGGGSRVLLREPERCPVCARVFLSLYPLKDCVDHDGLDRI